MLTLYLFIEKSSELLNKNYVWHNRGRAGSDSKIMILVFWRQIHTHMLQLYRHEHRDRGIMYNLQNIILIKRTGFSTKSCSSDITCVPGSFRSR